MSDLTYFLFAAGGIVLIVGIFFPEFAHRIAAYPVASDFKYTMKQAKRDRIACIGILVIIAIIFLLTR